MALPVLCLVTFIQGQALAVQGLDCNRNGADDEADLRAGAQDCNDNRLPDECEFAPLTLGVRKGDAGVVHRQLLFLEVSDLDGDGLDDLLEAHGPSSRLSHIALHQASAGGAFRVVADYEVAGRLEGATGFDVNDDGRKDVILASSTSFLVLQNEGGGVFEEPRQLAAELPAGAIGNGDTDGDGRPELILRNESQNRLDVLRVEGSQALVDVGLLALEERPSGFVAADLDGDGDSDLVVTTQRTDHVSIGVSRGDHSFLPPRIYPAGGRRPDRPQVRDLDGDGDLDIVVATFDGLSLLMNDGEGSLAAPRLAVDAFSSYALGDLDADGDVDLATASRQTLSVGVAVGDGRGNFGEALSVRMEFRPGALVGGEFTGGGAADLAVTENDGLRLQLLSAGALADEGPLLLRPRHIHLGDNPHSATVGDFNGDGILDVVESGGHARQMLVRLSEGGAPLATSDLYRFEKTARRLFSIDTGDFDRDGDLDLVMADSETHVLKVVSNDGAGRFENEVDHEVGRGPMMVHAADVDDDGRLDLISADTSANSATVLLGEDTGAFSATKREVAVGTSPRALFAVDLDLDGDREIIVANLTSADLSILWNDGGAALRPARTILLLGNPLYVIAVDLDADGDADVVAANTATDDVGILINDGRGNLAPPVYVGLGREPYSVRSTDANGDGLVDLVTGNWRSDSVSVLLGKGDGTLERPHAYAVGEQPRFVLPGDFDLDGDIDLVSANYGTQDLTWLVHYQRLTFDVPFAREVCTEFQFHELSVATEGDPSVATKSS